MYIDYETYLLSIRNSLIQNGVEFSEGVNQNLSDYYNLFKLGLKIEDLLYYYKVLAVSGSEYGLSNFFLPLNESYKDRVRKLCRNDFYNDILPNYKKLIGVKDNISSISKSTNNIKEVIVSTNGNSKSVFNTVEISNSKNIEYVSKGVVLDEGDSDDEFLESDYNNEEDDSEVLKYDNELSESDYTNSDDEISELDYNDDEEDLESNYSDDEEIYESNYSDDEDDEVIESNYDDDEVLESNYSDSDEEDDVLESNYSDSDDDEIFESDYSDNDDEILESNYSDDDDEDEILESNYSDEDDEVYESNYSDDEEEVYESDYNEEKTPQVNGNVNVKVTVKKDLGDTLQDYTNKVLTKIKSTSYRLVNRKD